MTTEVSFKAIAIVAQPSAIVTKDIDDTTKAKPIGIRGGGACLDCLAGICVCCAIEEICCCCALEECC
ncbi:unnamed protein product [Didymodactylos carnosus]|uniref:Cysteine-rich transmembrane CYSTM domain-containing protein n=1 Tax=Didymodactylos carnosus TaxID=1234261 RepID=A0A816CQA1_9BILA|nr:unnamed protein product [Didymodactylos carnosus]CAF1624802.1 unnamed protein product [Didymodactylos carnosus]CAF3977374.1 unnamed protein product [Didymodactylos carnosus]CAF4518043.1 unnamed protein product [Didymodactylos carnosus]